jgi:hypothetical protein
VSKFKTILTDSEANHDDADVIGVQNIIKKAGISCEYVDQSYGELISNGEKIQVLFSAEHFAFPNDFEVIGLRRLV